MFSVGLTGGIGSGKTQVADLLAAWGASVIDTDKIAHALTAARGAALPAICAEFGAQSIAQDGAMDREVMRRLVFEQPKRRAALEAILHPLIDDQVRAQAQRARGTYLVYVVPLLVESGRWRSRVDRICVVDCDPVTQIARVQARSGLTSDAITRIMSAQASRAVRLAAADDVVLNDGGTDRDELTRRTRLVHDRWCAMAAGARLDSSQE
ncbi:dephospho-CoA kinase [Alcaligenaceae bacterium CGII-47]|nr:dephospho-CoA kinase [Alcaligenaceae bacterium CGII-47]